MTPNLFGEVGSEENCQQWRRNGSAAELLVTADLMFRGCDAANMGGNDADIVADIGATIRKIQVKSSVSTSFAPVRGKTTSSYRPLNSYKGKIDAFAFVYVPRKAVYYIHVDAVISSGINIPESSWGRQQCDLSFNELLKRWDCL